MKINRSHSVRSVDPKEIIRPQNESLGTKEGPLSAKVERPSIFDSRLAVLLVEEFGMLAEWHSTVFRSQMNHTLTNRFL